MGRAIRTAARPCREESGDEAYNPSYHPHTKQRDATPPEPTLLEPNGPSTDTGKHDHATLVFLFPFQGTRNKTRTKHGETGKMYVP